MKLKFTFLMILLVSLFCTQLTNAQRKPSSRNLGKSLSARQIAKRVLPSVVLIITQDEQGRPIGQGSGFVYKPGLVVSNLHVFKRASRAIVKNVVTGEISKALQVVAMNAKDDLCLIRISNNKFPSLRLGNSDAIATGDDIYVASNPKGLEGSFTKGIVSSMRNSAGLFQIDAAISAGSSGGAVINQRGNVVGIVSSSLVQGQNLNFAIPINKIRKLRLRFNHPILLAGACAVTDSEAAKLKGIPKIVTERTPYKTELITSSVTTYDRNGNEIEAITYQVDGRFAWKYNYLVDENRLRTAMIYEEVGGTMPDTTYFTFAQSIDFKLFMRTFSGTRGELSGKAGKQIYDRNGNTVIWYTGNTKITFKYDSEGLRKEAIQSRKGKVYMRTRYQYREDRIGNWIEKTSFNKFPNNPEVSDKWWKDSTDYREITYYE